MQPRHDGRKNANNIQRTEAKVVTSRFEFSGETIPFQTIARSLRLWYETKDRPAAGLKNVYDILNGPINSD